jgi:hypothetical protein
MMLGKFCAFPQGIKIKTDKQQTKYGEAKKCHEPTIIIMKK